MPGRWSDERDWEGRDWRSRGRERDEGERGYRGQSGEERSFDDDAPRHEGGGRDRVFGERDTGAGYNEPAPRYGRGGGRSYYRGDYGGRPAWQDRDYQGVSPAMQQGEYELERHRPLPRFRNQDYTRGGGRFYGDDSRGQIYREEYGQGGRDFGREPRGWDAGYRDFGGYDDDRGYGGRGRESYPERGGRGEEFFRRAGERISSWFGNAAQEVRNDLRGERTGHRGRGPKGYQRPDDRISDEAHQRLTDDPWVDATNVSISVSGGELTLSGTVDSREAKHRAERCVEDILGVKHVQNNLRVEGGNFFTRAGAGYGDSAAEAQMRSDTGANGGSASTDDSAATRTTTRRT